MAEGSIPDPAKLLEMAESRFGKAGPWIVRPILLLLLAVVVMAALVALVAGWRYLTGTTNSAPAPVHTAVSSVSSVVPAALADAAAPANAVPPSTHKVTLRARPFTTAPATASRHAFPAQADGSVAIKMNGGNLATNDLSGQGFGRVIDTNQTNVSLGGKTNLQAPNPAGRATMTVHSFKIGKPSGCQQDAPAQIAGIFRDFSLTQATDEFNSTLKGLCNEVSGTIIMEDAHVDPGGRWFQNVLVGGSTVGCTWSATERSALSQLRASQAVRVRGKLESGGPGGFSMSECELVP